MAIHKLVAKKVVWGRSKGSFRRARALAVALRIGQMRLILPRLSRSHQGGEFGTWYVAAFEKLRSFGTKVARKSVHGVFSKSTLETFRWYRAIKRLVLAHYATKGTHNVVLTHISKIASWRPAVARRAARFEEFFEGRSVAQLVEWYKGQGAGSLSSQRNMALAVSKLLSLRAQVVSGKAARRSGLLVSESRVQARALNSMATKDRDYARTDDALVAEGVLLSKQQLQLTFSLVHKWLRSMCTYIRSGAELLADEAILFQQLLIVELAGAVMPQRTQVYHHLSYRRTTPAGEDEPLLLVKYAGEVLSAAEFVERVPTADITSISFVLRLRHEKNTTYSAVFRNLAVPRYCSPILLCFLQSVRPTLATNPAVSSLFLSSAGKPASARWFWLHMKAVWFELWGLPICPRMLRLQMANAAYSLADHEADVAQRDSLLFLLNHRLQTAQNSYILPRRTAEMRRGKRLPVMRQIAAISDESESDDGRDLASELGQSSSSSDSESDSDSVSGANRHALQCFELLTYLLCFVQRVTSCITAS